MINGVGSVETTAIELPTQLSFGKDRKVLRQQWECIVIEKSQDIVRCVMHDLTNEENPAEYAEIFSRSIQYL